MTPRHGQVAARPQASLSNARREALSTHVLWFTARTASMMGTLGLAARGYFVEPGRSTRTVARGRASFPVADAAPEELKTYGVEAVPGCRGFKEQVVL